MKRRALGNDITLGKMPGQKTSLLLPSSERDKHLYVCGSTGTGKSKFLENLIRQDIRKWDKSKCGMLVFDPHGSLYDSTMNWLAWRDIDRPIVPIDLRQDDWIVSYNTLRKKKNADPSVVADNITNAIAYVWNQSGIFDTPLLARWTGNIVHTLYEKDLTLIESAHLIDRVSKEMRFKLTHDLEDRNSRQDWQFANTLSPKDFDLQISSTANRLRTFIKNEILHTIFGLPDVSFDFETAIEEGQIIIVSLSTRYGKVSEDNSHLFATLMLHDLWMTAKDREKDDNPKPFYLYLDEFQKYVSPTIADNLDQARGFGLHLTMAHQFPNQLRNLGPNGQRVYDSVMENASSKVSFRLQHEDNLSVMAKSLFRGIMDPDEVKHKLYSTKVMEYREEMKEIYTKGTAIGSSYGKQIGSAAGSGSGGTEYFAGDDTSEVQSSSQSDSDFSSASEGENWTWSEVETETKSYVPTLVPVLGKELSHVQFRSLEEQLFRAMAVLFDQQERQCVGRVVGMNAPVSLFTPTVEKMPGSKERTQRFLDKCYDRLDFALPGSVARKAIKKREEDLPKELLNEIIGEESLTAKRRISKS